MIKGEVLYYHGRTSDGYRFTIAGKYEASSDDDQIDIIIVGVSLCSKKDQFVKRTGRLKAEGRMKSHGLHGRSYFNLYDESRPLNWFKGHEVRLFVEKARLTEALTRNGFIHKFNLKRYL